MNSHLKYISLGNTHYGVERLAQNKNARTQWIRANSMSTELDTSFFYSLSYKSASQASVIL